MRTQTNILLIIVSLLGICQAELSLHLSSSDDLSAIKVGEKVTIDVSLNGMDDSMVLTALTGNVEFSSHMLSTTNNITSGDIIQDPFSFLGIEAPGLINASFDSLFSGPKISSDGLFFSFEVMAKQVGTGTFSLDPLSLTAVGRDPNGMLPQVLFLEAGPVLPFKISPAEPVEDKVTLTLSSTRGGCVETPGEGDFEYTPGDIVLLEAQADPYFKFAGWQGDVDSDENPMEISVDEDLRILAVFYSTLDTIFVDDDAPHDPGPGTIHLSDPYENGTPERPFDSIQEAIEVAAPGVKIIVLSGTYKQNLVFQGRNVLVTGQQRCDSKEPLDFPIIQGVKENPAVCFMKRENQDTILKGFIITGGNGDKAGGVLCKLSNPTLENCLIVGNRSRMRKEEYYIGEKAGAGLYCDQSQVNLINCSILDNFDRSQAASVYCDHSVPIFINSILWNPNSVEIQTYGDAVPHVSYSTVKAGFTGDKNLEGNPLVIKHGYWKDPKTDKRCSPVNPEAVWIHGDYHLQKISPCIDRGDPSIPVQNEPEPNGKIINQGTYGGTCRATVSPK